MTNSNIFVISAPSGAGKSSLVKEVCKLNKNLKLSISHTTRSLRPGELPGVDYYFVSKEEFINMLDNNDFIEYANVYGDYYGTNKTTISHFLNAGNNIILEIDWQGAQQIKSLIKEAVLIYILPPSLQELENRLRLRNTDTEEVIAKRLSLANDDMSHARDFDHVIINDKFENALQRLYSIIMQQK